MPGEKVREGKNGLLQTAPSKLDPHSLKKHCFKISGFLSCGGREGNGSPLQHPCLENPTDGGGWWAAVHGVAKSRTQLSDFTFTHWRRKWQPTPEFVPGESRGRRSLVGCRLWGRTGSDTADATQQQQLLWWSSSNRLLFL